LSQSKKRRKRNEKADLQQMLQVGFSGGGGAANPNFLIV
jgi:hypothetical protein